MKKNSNYEKSIYKKTLIHYIPGVLIPAFSNIFLTLGLARILNVELYGYYAYYISIATLLTSLFSQWLVQSIQRFNNTEKDNSLYEDLINMIRHFFIILFLTSFISFLFSEFISYGERSYKLIFVVIMLFTAQSLTAVKVAIYSTNYQAKSIKNMNIMQAFLKLIVVIIYLITFDEYQISHIFMAISLAVFINVILQINSSEKKNLKYFLTIRTKNLNNIFSYSKPLLAYGLPMTGWFIGTNLLNIGDRFVLKYFTDPAEVGIYSANYMLVSTGIGLLVSPLLQTAHPIIMNYGQKNFDNKEKISIFIEDLSRKYILISLFIVVNMMLYYKKISLLLFGNDYTSGAIIIPLTLIGIFFWNYSMYGHKGLELSNKPLKMMKFVLICALVNVLLNVLLIPWLGILGAGISTVVAYFSYFVMIKINSESNIKWIINYKYIAKYLAIITIISLILSPVINYILNLLIDLIK